MDEAQLKYPEVDKQVYVVFKAVKHFRPYLLKSQTKVVVPYPVVRNLFVQKEIGEVHTYWMTMLQEFDLKIKPAKIIQGQGLCQMPAEAMANNGWENETMMYEPESVQVIDVSKSRYSDLKHYLSIEDIPIDLDSRKQRALRLKSGQYQLVSGILFRKKIDNVLLRCLEKDESPKLLSSLHEGPDGGNFAVEVTTHKTLKVGYYWPTLFKDAHAHVSKCEECQKSVGMEKRPTFTLQHVGVENPFQQWGGYVIVEIHPASSGKHKYIITATDYFTRWSEVATLMQINEN